MKSILNFDSLIIKFEVKIKYTCLKSENLIYFMYDYAILG